MRMCISQGTWTPDRLRSFKTKGGPLSIIVRALSSDAGKSGETAEKSEIRHIDNPQKSAENGFKDYIRTKVTTLPERRGGMGVVGEGSQIMTDIGCGSRCASNKTRS